jgi:hypothetical protein
MQRMGWPRLPPRVGPFSKNPAPVEEPAYMDDGWTTNRIEVPEGVEVDPYPQLAAFEPLEAYVYRPNAGEANFQSRSYTN